MTGDRCDSIRIVRQERLLAEHELARIAASDARAAPGQDLNPPERRSLIDMLPGLAIACIVWHPHVRLRISEPVVSASATPTIVNGVRSG